MQSSAHVGGSDLSKLSPVFSMLPVTMSVASTSYLLSPIPSDCAPPSPLDINGLLTARSAHLHTSHKHYFKARLVPDTLTVIPTEKQVFIKNMKIQDSRMKSIEGGQKRHSINIKPEIHLSASNMECIIIAEIASEEAGKMG